MSFYSWFTFNGQSFFSLQKHYDGELKPSRMTWRVQGIFSFLFLGLPQEFTTLQSTNPQKANDDWRSLFVQHCVYTWPYFIRES